MEEACVDSYLSFFILSSWILLWFSAASVFDLILVMVSDVSFLICSKNPIQLQLDSSFFKYHRKDT